MLALRFRNLLSVVLAPALLLAGCGSPALQNPALPDNPAPKPPALKGNTFVYVASRHPSNLYGFKLDMETGRLDQVPGSPEGVDYPVHMAASADGKFLFVPSFADDGFVRFEINGDSGELTWRGWQDSRRAYATAVHPNGKHLYILDGDSAAVTAFTIESSGSLSFQSQHWPERAYISSGLAIDPAGKYLLTTLTEFDGSERGLALYAIDSLSGNLTFQQRKMFEEHPRRLAITPDGSWVVATSTVSNTLAIHRKPHGGIVDAPVSIASAGESAFGVAVHPNGRFVYVTAYRDNFVYGFSLSGTGALTPLPGFPFPAGYSPSGIAIDPTGQFLIVSHQKTAIEEKDGVVRVFRVGAEGDLTQVGEPVVIGPYSISVVVVQR